MSTPQQDNNQNRSKFNTCIFVFKCTMCDWANIVNISKSTQIKLEDQRNKKKTNCFYVWFTRTVSLITWQIVWAGNESTHIFHTISQWLDGFNWLFAPLLCIIMMIGCQAPVEFRTIQFAESITQPNATDAFLNWMLPIDAEEKRVSKNV